MAAIESPCILVCSVDMKTGYCFGCGRTREEIVRLDRDDAGAPPRGDGAVAGAAGDGGTAAAARNAAARAWRANAALAWRHAAFLDRRWSILAVGLIILVAMDSSGEVLGLSTDDFGNLVYLVGAGRGDRRRHPCFGPALRPDGAHAGDLAAGDPGADDRLRISLRVAGRGEPRQRRTGVAEPAVAAPTATGAPSSPCSSGSTGISTRPMSTIERPTGSRAMVDTGATSTELTVRRRRTGRLRPVGAGVQRAGLHRQRRGQRRARGRGRRGDRRHRAQQPAAAGGRIRPARPEPARHELHRHAVGFRRARRPAGPED